MAKQRLVEVVYEPPTERDVRRSFRKGWFIGFASGCMSGALAYWLGTMGGTW